MSYWVLKYMENGFEITKKVDENDKKGVDELFRKTMSSCFMSHQYVLEKMEDGKER